MSNDHVRNLKLAELLASLEIEHLKPCIDSRLVEEGNVFLAYPGEAVDGRSFIAQAIEQGASCILWDSEGDFVWQDQWQVKNCAVADLKKHISEVASWFCGYPSENLDVIGITGTNGKTSISQWLAQALTYLNYPCGIMGTVGNGFWGNLQTASLTTPDALSIQNFIKQFHDEGAKAVSMEVSSHGLSQSRVDGVCFDGAVFTNLTRDHLDYHGSFEHYGQAKLRIFMSPSLKYAVVNIDDPFGLEIKERLKQERPNVFVYTYGFSSKADIVIKNFKPSSSGMEVLFSTHWGECSVHTGLLGRFNAQNLAATLAVLYAQGFSLKEIAAVLPKIRPAIGRMDCVIHPGKPLVVVDYAHTPDALEKALTTLQEIKAEEGKLWCVFGCGGNRDKGKRPLMGEVVSRLADCPVVTSDNPRLESPEEIIKDILVAVTNPTYVQEDRKQAIEYAIRHANTQDIILIAGKGHEDYQDIAGKKRHFSDFEIAQTALEGRE